MSNFKDDYYSQVDQVFDKLKVTPFEERVGGTSVPQEDGGQIQPVGWVENADATDGTATVKIDSDGITITDGKLSVEDASGNSIISGGVVKALTNDGAEVVIDGSGITVTDGAITVSNASATVIIDGTSRMFRIAASGSLSITVPGWTAGNLSESSSVVALTGLGVQDTIPGHLSFIGASTSPTDFRRIGDSLRRLAAPVYAAASSGGSPTVKFMAPSSEAVIYTYLSLSNIAQAVLIGQSSETAAVNFFGYYHVLLEEAL